MTYRVIYRADNSPPITVTADFMKYDSGTILLVREVNNKSRCIAIFNSEAIREIIELDAQNEKERS